MDVDCFIHLCQPNRHLVAVAVPLHDSSVGRYVGRSLELENVVVDHLEVVDQLDPQVAPTHNIVLHIYQAVDLDVDSKAIRGKLGGNLLVDFDKHVVAALDNRLF